MPNKEFKAEILFRGKVEPSVHESFEKFHEQLKEIQEQAKEATETLKEMGETALDFGIAINCLKPESPKPPNLIAGNFKSQIAESPLSAVRIRTASSIVETNIFPSPIAPVLPASMIASIASSTNESATATIIS